MQAASGERRQRDQRGCRQIRSALNPATLFGCCDARHQRTAADIQEIPAQTEQEQRGKIMRECIAGQRHHNGDNIGQQPGRQNFYYAKTLDQTAGKERWRKHRNNMPLNDRCIRRCAKLCNIYHLQGRCRHKISHQSKADGRTDHTHNINRVFDENAKRPAARTALYWLWNFHPGQCQQRNNLHHRHRKITAGIKIARHPIDSITGYFRAK